MTGQWFSPGTPVSSYNIDRHNIVESGVAHHNPNSHGTLKKMTANVVGFRGGGGAGASPPPEFAPDYVIMFVSGL